MSSDLAADFDALGPWVTKFEIDGESYGGQWEVLHDPRVAQFHDAFPDAETILELGSFEGGQTARLARLEGVCKVVGLEGRSENLARAQFVLKVLGVSNAEVALANLERFDLSTLGPFDAVFNCGLLYHLPRPWELLGRILTVTDRMYLSTHYCKASAVNASEHGWPGFWYQEFGREDPLSGLAASSFWPTRDALFDMLATAGFEHVEVMAEERDHPNGPLICLNARRRPRRRRGRRHGPRRRRAC